MPSKSFLHNRIATDLDDVEEIQKRIHTSKPAQAGPETVYVPPRTPIEKKLAEIWAELLERPQVGIHDNFFDLGGHSLMATQMLSRVHTVFQVELPLDVILLDNFTVAELAREIEQRQIEQADPEELATMLKLLDELSDEETRALLASQGFDALDWTAQDAKN